MENHRGRKSIVFPRPPVILAHASVAGKKESEGPLRDTFDVTSKDTKFGQKSVGKGRNADAENRAAAWRWKRPA